MDLLLLGALFLVGLLADLIGRYTILPRVSVLLLSGLLIGPGVLALIPAEVAEAWFPALTQMALAMVGFLLGQKLTLRALKEHGGGVVWLSITKALGAAIAVFAACVACGVAMPLALVLAGIAPATAPAATFDVVHETESKGEFTDTLLNVVALDDAWGLILFALLLAFATSNGATLEGVATGVSEIGGSVLLGAALGLPMAFLTGRIVFGARAGEPIMAESLGFVFIAAGLSSLLDLSPILTAVSMGAVVASLASHHKQPFDAIEGIEWPFMILFFVLADASLHLEYLSGAGWVVLIYLAARTVGTVLGIMFGGSTAGMDKRITRWLGLALLPQAGVALGLSLIAAQELPEYGQTILTVVLTSTVVLELTSPVITRAVLRRDVGNPTQQDTR
jgi:Kef-type K+ transport system membrane component KefB